MACGTPSLAADSPDKVLDLGVCCWATGACVVMTEEACAQACGDFLGIGLNCEPNPCPPVIGTACCLPDGTCQLEWEGMCLCLGGTMVGFGTDCDPNPCVPIPVGACCLQSGECLVVTAEECAGLQGLFLGFDIPCVPDPCGTPAEPSSWGRIKLIYR